MNPQSPTIREAGGVVTERCVGNGVVAVSDLCLVARERSVGADIGAGIENIRDALNSAAPGETLRAAGAVAIVQGCARGRAQSNFNGLVLLYNRELEDFWSSGPAFKVSTGHFGVGARTDSSLRQQQGLRGRAVSQLSVSQWRPFLSSTIRTDWELFKCYQSSFAEYSIIKDQLRKDIAYIKGGMVLDQGCPSNTLRRTPHRPFVDRARVKTVEAIILMVRIAQTIQWNVARTTHRSWITCSEWRLDANKPRTFYSILRQHGIGLDWKETYSRCP